jgi:L-arabinose transport system substrate-binding protein
MRNVAPSRRTTALVVAVAAALAAAPVAAQDAQDAPIKMAYLTKHLDNPWFVNETNGARELADELGIDLTIQDLQFDANLALTAMDTVIADGTQGIIIVVPEQQIGPAVIEKARSAGVPLVAVDDVIQDAEGNFAPFVGFQASSVGQQVGEEAARLFTEKGWDAANTRVASIEMQTLSVCMDRTESAIATFTSLLPDFPAENILNVPYDGTLAGATPVMTDTLTANPGISNWVLWSCNDDGVLGAVRALEASGIPADDATGVGLGAHLACDEWAKDAPTSFDSAVFLDSANHGKAAVQVLYDHIVNGEEIPAESIIPGPIVTEEAHDELACPA